MRIDQTTIILTGAASGIGRALLHALVREHQPHYVVAADRDAAALHQTLAELPATTSGPNVVAFVGDLSDPAELDRLFATALTYSPHVDLIFANAGFAYYETLGPPDWARLERIFRVNTFAPIYLYQRARTQATSRPFRVVITASAMAHLAVPGYALYGATKAALDRFRDGLRHEPGTRGTLTLVYPVATRTDFFRQAVAQSTQMTPGVATPGVATPGIPWPSHTPEQVAQAILQGVRRDAERVYPSALFRLLRFPLWLYETINWPYQAYYARSLRSR